MSQRAKIRTNAVEMLKTATTHAGNRIYGDRVGPLFDENYPLILVYARSEQTRPQSISPSPMLRVLSLSIEIRTTIAEGQSVDAVLDQICAQVEGAIKDDPTIGHSVVSCNLLETEFEVSPSGDQVLGGARLTYELIYEE